MMAMPTLMACSGRRSWFPGKAQLGQEHFRIQRLDPYPNILLE